MAEILLEQFVLLEDPLWPLAVAIGISVLFFWGYLKLIARRRHQLIGEIDHILNSRSSIALSELSYLLDSRGMDLKTLYELVGRTRNGILSYSKTSVVSSVGLRKRIKDTLVNNSIVHVDKEAIRWDVAPAKIEQIVHDISEQEGLDILRTKDGDYLLVPELKERIRESLELQGRADVVAEAQRLRVDVDELVHLIKSWGWYVWQSSSGLVYSVKWLLGTLERSISKMGFLDLEHEAARLDLTPDDILKVVTLYKWDLVEGFDDKLLPLHLLQEDLTALLESQGHIDVNVEANRLKISTDTLKKVLQKLGLTLITTNDGSVMTIDQVKQEILDDIELAGILKPKETAMRIGIDTRLAEKILSNHPDVRKVRDGRFVSYRALRNHILEEVKSSGIVHADEFEKRWLVSRVELAALLKRFGLKTVSTHSGDYLSISWVRRWLAEALSTGELLDPEEIAKRFDTEPGVIESIVATIESDTLLDADGKMVSKDALLNELKREFHDMGVLRPYDLAIQRGLDTAEIEKTIQPLVVDSYRTWDDNYVNRPWLLRKIAESVNRNGIVDISSLCEELELDFDEVQSDVEDTLTDDQNFFEECGVVISTQWLALLKDHISEAGPLNVTEFAKSRSISKKTALCVLRKVLTGIYLPSSDSFFTKT